MVVSLPRGCAALHGYYRVVAEVLAEQGKGLVPLPFGNTARVLLPTEDAIADHPVETDRRQGCEHRVVVHFAPAHLHVLVHPSGIRADWRCSADRSRSGGSRRRPD